MGRMGISTSQSWPRYNTSSTLTGWNARHAFDDIHPPPIIFNRVMLIYTQETKVTLMIPLLERANMELVMKEISKSGRTEIYKFRNRWVISSGG